MKSTIKKTGISLFLISMVLVPAHSLKAQTKDFGLKKIYLQGGTGIVTNSYSNNNLGLQAIINNKWSTTFSYHSFSQKPGNLPADYQPETGSVFFIPFTNDIKLDMNIFSLTAGKYFQLGKNTWLTMEGGLSLVNGQKATFTPANQSFSTFLFLTTNTTSNYQYTVESKTAMGEMVRADFNWAFTSFMGLGAGVFCNFNPIQSPFGFQINLILGGMNIHSRNKN
jgi:hypothetical protein